MIVPILSYKEVQHGFVNALKKVVQWTKIIDRNFKTNKMHEYYSKKKNVSSLMINFNNILQFSSSEQGGVEVEPLLN